VVADWAKHCSLTHHMDLMNGGKGKGWQYLLARKLFLSGVHSRLGFDRAADPIKGGLYSGAAPLSSQTFKYFLSLDLPIMELLGSSETCGPQTGCLPRANTKMGSVGKCFPHFQTKILDPDENGVGEIVTRGRQVCLGYLWDEEKTRSLFTSDGWVHSGDIGTVDENGFFYVTGREKELIITSGGENIAPFPVEDAINTQLGDVISNVMLVGDKRKFLTVLIALKSEVDENDQPTEILQENVRTWLKSLGSRSETTAELIEENCENVNNAISNAIETANKSAVSRAHCVHRFCLLPTSFSLASGELTPTLKVKRHFVLEKYKPEIEKMYSSVSVHSTGDSASFESSLLEKIYEGDSYVSRRL